MQGFPVELKGPTSPTVWESPFYMIIFWCTQQLCGYLNNESRLLSCRFYTQWNTSRRLIVREDCKRGNSLLSKFTNSNRENRVLSYLNTSFHKGSPPEWCLKIHLILIFYGRIDTEAFFKCKVRLHNVDLQTALYRRAGGWSLSTPDSIIINWSPCRGTTAASSTAVNSLQSAPIWAHVSKAPLRPLMQYALLGPGDGQASESECLTMMGSGIYSRPSTGRCLKGINTQRIVGGVGLGWVPEDEAYQVLDPHQYKKTASLSRH